MKAGIAAAIALVGTLASGNTIAANTMDGNSILKNCNATLRIMDGKKLSSDDDEIGIGQCLGLVEGVRNTLVYLNSFLARDLQICWPENGIQNGQAIRIIVKYLTDHPASLNMDQTLLTMLAFKDAYPCKK